MTAAALMDFDTSGVSSVLDVLLRPRVVIEQVEIVPRATPSARITLDSKIFITETPVRHLSLMEQKTFDAAFRASGKVRQKLKL